MYTGQWNYQNPVIINFTAYASITGGPDYPGIRGIMTFRNVPGGTEVCANIAGLPQYQPAKNGKQPIGPFGLHLHEHGSCEVGDPKDPFHAAGGHWNPTSQPHG